MRPTPRSLLLQGRVLHEGVVNPIHTRSIAQLVNSFAKGLRDRCSELPALGFEEAHQLSDLDDIILVPELAEEQSERIEFSLLLVDNDLDFHPSRLIGAGCIFIKTQFFIKKRKGKNCSLDSSSQL